MRETVSIEVPAYVGEVVKAMSKAVGGLTEGQVIETFIGGLDLFSLLCCMRDAWEWTNEKELTRFNEAWKLGEACDWELDAFMERVDAMPDFEP